MRRQRARLVLGGLLLGAYALPLFVPPGASPLVSPSADTGLLDRLFPGVPAAWVALRLSCLALGAAALATLVRSVPLRAVDRRLAASPHVPPLALGLAVGIAAIQVVSAGFVLPRLSRLGELAWLLLLALPPLVLWLAERRATGGASGDPGRRGALVCVVGLALMWAGLRLGGALHAPRTALPVDLWEAFTWLLEAAQGPANALLGSGQPGISNSFMLFLGLPFARPGDWIPSLAEVQALHVAWILLAALLVALLAARAIGPVVAPVAAAVFLASPFVLLLPHSPAPFGLYLCFAAAVALLLQIFASSGSLAALSALGVVGGLAATTAYLLHWVALAGLATGWLLWRQRPRSTWAWVLPALCFTAAAWPALPGAEDVRVLVTEYVDKHGDWAVLEAILTGQRSPFTATGRGNVWWAGRPGPFDVALGSLLSPFAAPRSAIRLWGDAIFDPLGASLAAVGLAVCLRFAVRDTAARLLLLVLVAALLPGTLTSAYDRASLTRNIALPLTMALLGATGFEAVRRALLPRAGALASLAVALVLLMSGTVLFDVVTPRLIPASAIAVQLEALGDDRPAGGALFLEHGRPTTIPWLRVPIIASHLPRRPIPVRPYTGPRSLYDAAGRLPGLLLWSPGLEHDERLTRVLCERWPGAALFRLEDRSGLAHAWAASPDGPGWEPRLPASRWKGLGCQDPGL